ncbi:MAG: hypothetical protein GY801_07105 [bacterium]|nr:hypothetical protein [bacterium]
MRTYLKEKIGNPELFTGRKREPMLYLKWVEHIKRESSLSSAILSRRKTGETALLQRLYNLTFLYQYIAFHSRKSEYVKMSRKPEKSFDHDW